MPLFYAFVMTQVKKTIFRNKISQLDSIKNNGKFALSLAILGASMYAIHLIIAH